MDLGFDGASMGEIARSAGVSKGTLYVYFADKSRLFEAIVEEELLEQGKAAFNFDPERDVTATLLDFGQAYIQLLCRPGGGSAIRTVMAIAERMPEVGRRFYNNVVALTIAELAAYLEAHVRSGDLDIEDCQLAATQFMQMCQASLFMPFVFQAAPAPSAERIAMWSQRDADVSGGVSGEAGLRAAYRHCERPKQSSLAAQRKKLVPSLRSSQ